jgi:hypothetical protein
MRTAKPNEKHGERKSHIGDPETKNGHRENDSRDPRPPAFIVVIDIHEWVNIVSYKEQIDVWLGPISSRWRTRRKLSQRIRARI